MLEKVAIDLTDAETANQLGISGAPVRTHLVRLYRNNGFANRTEAVASLLGSHEGSDVPKHASSLDRQPRMRSRAILPFAMCLLSGITVCAACDAFGQPTRTVCVGTAVSDPSATYSIDVGILTKPEASAILRVGDVLFVGSNSCNDYGLPPSTSVAPVLAEVRRNVNPAPRSESIDALDVTYRAVAGGHVMIPVSCRGGSCPGSPIKVTVTVIEPP
jgi:hypothetical protein